MSRKEDRDNTAGDTPAQGLCDVAVVAEGIEGAYGVIFTDELVR